MTDTKYTDDLWDVTDIPRGTTVAKWYDEGIQVVVTRGGYGFCAYLGIPEDHPLAGFDREEIPLDCHGGLTFADAGDGDYLPKGYYFYGWDYAHAGDYTNFGPAIDIPEFAGDRKWTLGQVREDIISSLYNFRAFMTLAEAIAKKGNGQS